MRRAVNYAIDRRALARHPIPEALAGRPTDQHIPPGWPGFRDAAIYPLGGPDLATARRLAGDGRRQRRPLRVQRVRMRSSRPRSCARTSRRSGSTSRSGGSASASMFARMPKPRRAVRPVALGLGRRGPGPVGVRRRHVPHYTASHRVPRSHAAGAADTRREPARRAPRGSRPTPRWTATSRRRPRRSRPSQRRAHGLLLRTHRVPGRASALRHRPRRRCASGTSHHSPRLGLGSSLITGSRQSSGGP